MNVSIRSVCVLLWILAVSASPAFAIGNGGGVGGAGGAGGVGGAAGTSVPEIDPSGAASALTLLVGGTLLLMDRLRGRKKMLADQPTHS